MEKSNRDYYEELLEESKLEEIVSKDMQEGKTDMALAPAATSSCNNLTRIKDREDIGYESDVIELARAYQEIDAADELMIESLSEKHLYEAAERLGLDKKYIKKAIEIKKIEETTLDQYVDKIGKVPLLRTYANACISELSKAIPTSRFYYKTGFIFSKIKIFEAADKKRILARIDYRTNGGGSPYIDISVYDKIFLHICRPRLDALEKDYEKHLRYNNIRLYDSFN